MNNKRIKKVIATSLPTQVDQNHAAVQFVAECTAADTATLNNKLRLALAKLRLEMKQKEPSESTKQYVRIVVKGLHFASDSTGMERFYSYGRFTAQIENLLEDAMAQKRERDINTGVTARTAFAPIVRYLYRNGACQQKEIVADLHMDKANLSREMTKLEESGFVNKTKGSKFVYYELTQRGYIYCNRYFELKRTMEPHTTILRHRFCEELARDMERHSKWRGAGLDKIGKVSISWEREENTRGNASTDKMRAFNELECGEMTEDVQPAARLSANFVGGYSYV